MPNRLAEQTSPYLLQHQHNPVAWQPWDRTALAQAKEQDKPIFLSIGYAACHWCHVMEHESFENEAIAAKLNEQFVCIKVDREERPDLDQIYMTAVQLMTGRGGWPMSVFLTPGLEPFYGGTYWPPEPKMGMPGFGQVVDAVAEAWANRRQEALEMASRLTEHLQSAGLPEEDPAAPPGRIDAELLREAAARTSSQFDFQHGGFGGAPKFPHPMGMQFLLRSWQRQKREGLLEMVTLTLERMARGGIYDQLAGGFARYSVDAHWLVPHFEKMLYDNALLTTAYVEAFQATGRADFAQTARETCDWVLRDMTDPACGFHSTLDADSEGEEGKFYVWSLEEIQSILGEPAAERFAYVYDVTAGGNFEGHNILNLPKSLQQCAQIKGWDLAELESELAASRAKLLAVRSERIWPGKDDKVLVSWNGLMIAALARAGRVLGEKRYVAAAEKAANFLLAEMRREDGRLLHTWRGGAAKLDAYLDDYACLAEGLLELYQATFDEQRIDQAVELADAMLKHFRDAEGGGFFFTADDAEKLIARHKELQDSSVPSGSAMAATVLVKLGKLCGRADYLTAAHETLLAAVPLIRQAPTATGQMLLAADAWVGPLYEIVLLGDLPTADTQAALASLAESFIPNHLIACRANPDRAEGSAELEPIFVGKNPDPQRPVAYVCQNFTCGQPVVGLESLRQEWQRLAGGQPAP